MTTLIGYLDALDLKLVSSDKEEAYIKLAKKKAYDLKKYVFQSFVNLDTVILMEVCVYRDQDFGHSKR